MNRKQIEAEIIHLKKILGCSKVSASRAEELRLKIEKLYTELDAAISSEWKGLNVI